MQHARYLRNRPCSASQSNISPAGIWRLYEILLSQLKLLDLDSSLAILLLHLILSRQDMLARASIQLIRQALESGSQEARNTRIALIRRSVQVDAIPNSRESA